MTLNHVNQEHCNTVSLSLSHEWTAADGAIVGLEELAELVSCLSRLCGDGIPTEYRLTFSMTYAGVSTPF